MIVSVHQPQYIPWLGYFDKIAKSDCFVFLDNVQYKEREFQNRNKIRIKDGCLWLTVPAVSKGLARQKISDVRIDNTLPWPRKHLTSLKAWYGSSPFFNRHFPVFEKLYSGKWDRLIELNVHIITYILKQLLISKPIYFASQLEVKGRSTGLIIEICRKLKADAYLSGIGGRDYLEEAKFAAADIKLIYQDFRHPVYRQRFMRNENDFLPYMSTLDLLFNEGLKSSEILAGG